jgi:hypothetical protein
MTPVRPIRVIAAVLVALSLSVPIAKATPPTEPPGRSAHCFDKQDEAIPISIAVDGEPATGHYSLPDSWPTAFVVIGHGYGHSSYSWIEHMKTMSRDLGVIAVAMDYRGTEFQPQPWPSDGVPSTRGWRVMEGAEDSIAVTEFFLSICPSVTKTVILGVSMGGNATGLAVALAADERKENGSPLFDYWIDAEGVNNVIETYSEARAVSPFNAFAKNAYEDIKAEMGGKDFEQDPGPYVEHSNAARIDDIKDSGVKGVVVIHGVNDGLVPYNQSREFVQELVAVAIPVDMFTVGRVAPGSESGTTLTGNAGFDPGFAGHASERSTTHSVMTTSFAQLKSIVVDASSPGPYREFLVDSGKTYPEP